MTGQKPISVKSLAAPTPEEEAALRALSPDERKALLEAELAKGKRDIEAGRCTDLRSEKEMRKFFEDIRAADEVKAV